MISKIRQYFFDLGIIDENSNINVDFLSNEPIEYVIEPIPIEPILRQYADGSSLRQFVFQFGSREYFGADVIQNMRNTEFYEDFSELIEDNNRKGVLPKINGIQSIECLNNGTINEDNTNNAKYVIQMRITYYKD
mgnify:FL=1